MIFNFLFVLISSVALAQDKPIVIAVLDTGFGYSQESLNIKHLCKYGHKDFTNDNEYVFGLNTVDKVPKDMHGHGTNVTGLIEKNASTKNYCFVILKVFSLNPYADNLKSEIEAIRYATNVKADFINYSGGGKALEVEERLAVKNYLDSGGIFFAAAGNDNNDLGKIPYYPALSDSRVIVIGGLNNDNEKFKPSNFGKRVDFMEKAVNQNAYGLTFSGTSQATAISTGKYLFIKEKNMIKVRKELH